MKRKKISRQPYSFVLAPGEAISISSTTPPRLRWVTSRSPKLKVPVSPSASTTNTLSRLEAFTPLPDSLTKSLKMLPLLNALSGSLTGSSPSESKNQKYLKQIETKTILYPTERSTTAWSEKLDPCGTEGILLNRWKMLWWIGPTIIAPLRWMKKKFAKWRDQLRIGNKAIPPPKYSSMESRDGYSPIQYKWSIGVAP